VQQLMVGLGAFLYGSGSTTELFSVNSSGIDGVEQTLAQLRAGWLDSSIPTPMTNTATGR
jgi:hypothetical protein